MQMMAKAHATRTSTPLFENDWMMESAMSALAICE
jgi:hypothetical protein